MEGQMGHVRMMGCRGLAASHTFLLQGQGHAIPRMSPEAERLLSCLTLVLTVALPLDTWLAVSPSLPADEAEIIEQAIRNSLTRVEAEQGVANKLQLPHLGDPLLGVWESMHRAMQLVLAALLSLPIRSRIQHLDSAATTHTSATTQLPPGYHRCSACLLLSLRLALVFNENCIDELRGGEQHLARLHATLPGLLLGLSTSVTVMQAAGHPEAEVQRVHFVRFLLNLGILQSRILLEDIRDHCQDVATYPTDKVTTSYPDYLAHLLASSPVVTGWPGSPPAKPSYEHSYSTAGASSGVQGSSQGQSGKGSSTGSPMDLASVNTYAHVAQALCAVLGRQKEGLIITQLVSMCQAEGPESWSNLQEDAACLASTAMGGQRQPRAALVQSPRAIRVLRPARAVRPSSPLSSACCHAAWSPCKLAWRQLGLVRYLAHYTRLVRSLAASGNSTPCSATFCN
ncbi:hypothetical protein HaLaN_19960 [Haematococcus lacustris]|uniref:Uncharacterized protein n=1 Tax=Haematococcus lacustris TaxID=44745 RepID=A0A699ZUT3_HAELA|nr:hypothetical protein HaLaN_19960 [Haematococcus lacustris]